MDGFLKRHASHGTETNCTETDLPISQPERVSEGFTRQTKSLADAFGLGFVGIESDTVISGQLPTGSGVPVWNSLKKSRRIVHVTHCRTAGKGFVAPFGRSAELRFRHRLCRRIPVGIESRQQRHLLFGLFQDFVTLPKPLDASFVLLKRIRQIQFSRFQLAHDGFDGGDRFLKIGRVFR